ncbi:hypothetical protein TruAng_012222 [Truncatella angustata]|nr:hypothetical protein TruAng_012222 [Truncatella angustata]
MQFSTLFSPLLLVSTWTTIMASPLSENARGDSSDVTGTPTLAEPVIAARSDTPTATPKAKKVFAHYMLGTVTAEHANQDIDEAIAMGIDGFAFNIGDPSQPWVKTSLDNLIGYAEYRHFYYYFSLDVYASAEKYSFKPTAYKELLQNNLGNNWYYHGPNGNPMVSTFSSGGLNNTDWLPWKINDFGNSLYFIPDFDETAGYYESAAGWWEYWGDVVEGIFSWEAAWPSRSGFGGLYPGDVSPDVPVLAGATKHGKGYMIALSALQYKNSYGANVYRAGDLNLPVRMENILAMTESPDFIQLITWNDGPEGHYIGNIWYEQNNDTAPYRYANAIEWPHSGWQPLVASFIEAWKAGRPASTMAPPSGTPAVEALWYKTILQSSVCPESPGLASANTTAPDGFETGTDTLSYAIVIEQGGTGYTLQAWSNGKALPQVNLDPGLNYGSFTGIEAGDQFMRLYKNGAVVLAASGGRFISGGCPDCIYNMNPQVIPLVSGPETPGTCPYAVCEKQVFAHYMIGNMDEDHAHKDIDDAVAMGLDAFVLNVGDPTQPFVRQAFNYMFDYTRDNHPNFHLFMSMDLWAEGNAFNKVDLEEYHALLRDFKGHPAWLLGPDGNSFVSTFSSGGLNNTNITDWLNSWENQVYFVPDIDDTAGYNTSDPGWWDYWGHTIQGAFSWETAWPRVGVPVSADDYSVDQVVVDRMFQHIKSYIIPLSPLQYKDSYDTNYVRGGNLNLPLRIEAILNLNPSPSFVEYITWNDGPESHYMGNLWLEQNNDTQPLLYANAESPHTGWQPLITSFIAAFKAGLPPASMAPPSGVPAVGRYVVQLYPHIPEGWETAKDTLHFAVVLDPRAGGSATMHAISNGVELPQVIPLSPGLNYGSFSGISAGFQSMELRNSAGTVINVATGGRCISSGCPDCIYNLNPVVVGFGSGPTSTTGHCPDNTCFDLIPLDPNSSRVTSN